MSEFPIGPSLSVCLGSETGVNSECCSTDGSQLKYVHVICNKGDFLSLQCPHDNHKSPNSIM